jgi:hypothetical protein
MGIAWDQADEVTMTQTRFSPNAVIAGSAMLVLLLLLSSAAVFATAEPLGTTEPHRMAAATATDVGLALPTTSATATSTPQASPSQQASPDTTPEPSSTPSPTAVPSATPYRDTVWNARIYVKAKLGARGYDCINYIWTRESKWNPRAANSNGAYGIPQAYPGSKMASFGSNWRYSPLTQVKWGMWYVKNRYGSACNALTFFKSHGWY